MTGSGPRGHPWTNSVGCCPVLQVLPFGGNTGKMWLCSIASSSSSSSAELSVQKPGHTSKPPGRRYRREGALSLGANQHECVFEFARGNKVECVRRREKWRREWRETTHGELQEMICVSR